MLEKLQHLPSGIDGLKAIGKITREDYDAVLVPILDAARREGRRVRFLYQLGEEFEGITPGAAWEDAKIGLSSLRLFDGCAVVSDIGWIRESARLAGFIMPCPVHVFSNEARDEAVAWLSALPEEPALKQRLFAESGVLLVDVSGALRAQDFDALAVTADGWIEAHGRLRGMVIHVREFPGWENLGGLLHHMRFIRDHHRKVERVSLSADSRLANVVPYLAEHFVEAEVKTFAYDKLEHALAWAGAERAKPAEQFPAAPHSRV